MNWRTRRFVRALLVCALGACASACFSFDPDDGRYACNPALCPRDLVCGDDHRCWRQAPARDMTLDLAAEVGTVAITSPKETAYTHATIHVEVSATASLARVDLLVDEQPLATLTVPFGYDWDTTRVAEGAHRLVARALIAGVAVDSAARTVVVDRTPPTVLSQAPAPGAAGVLVHAPITVRFSEAMAPATVTDQTVTLTRGADTAIPKTLALSADGRTLALTPSALSSLPLPAQVTGGLTAGLEDLAGNRLQLPAAEWTWSIPSAIAIGSPFYAQSPSIGAIAIDKSGAPVIVSSASGNGGVQPFVRRWDGSDWVLLGGGPVDLTGRPELFTALAIDGANAPVVVFVAADPTFPKGALYVARWDGTAWKAGSTPINPNPSLSVGNDFAAATDPLSGNVIVVVNQGGLSLYTVDQSATVKRTSHALSVAGGTSNPAIAVDAGGNPFVSYLHFDTTTSAYVAQWRANGAAWLPQGGAINPVAGQNCKKGVNVEYRNWIALDKANAPSVAILESDGTHDNIYVERLNGATWELVGGALNASGRDTSVPWLAIDRASGTPFVAFYELDALNGVLNDAFVARFDGSGWAILGGPVTPAGAFNLNTLGGGNVGLVLDAAGRPMISALFNDLNMYVMAVNY